MYLMDAPSIRPALHDMASRLATAGYYVMLPYLFYRGGPSREFGSSDDDMHARRDLMGTVTPTGILADAAAMLAHADADAAAETNRFGAVGFCMSGGLTLACSRRLIPAAWRRPPRSMVPGSYATRPTHPTSDSSGRPPRCTWLVRQRSDRPRPRPRHDRSCADRSRSHVHTRLLHRCGARLRPRR